MSGLTPIAASGEFVALLLLPGRLQKRQRLWVRCNTFMNAGSFPYHCTVHPFMTAGVGVQGSSLTAPTLSAARIAGGEFQFTVNGKMGQTYLVQATSDFVNWAMTQTVLAPSDVFTVTNTPPAGLNTSFYRVQVQQ